MARAVTVKQLLATKRKVLPFTDDWEAALGCPEVTGSMIIWGDSGNGKTSFALQFMRYMSDFENTFYNSLEEGDSLSMARAFKRENLEATATGSVLLLDKEPINELIERLHKAKSANVVIIDSLQYSGLTYEAYKNLVETFRKKLFVFISHADGKDPAGAVAKAIKYDSHIKVHIKAFTAYITSRYGGGAPYIISQERATRTSPD